MLISTNLWEKMQIKQNIFIIMPLLHYNYMYTLFNRIEIVESKNKCLMFWKF